ncbi:unnamed protein product [Rotaria socialis]|uniref:Uncharacterized protein n=1 Tax=Rotaria socialis TaxID=392032 RepID=A0A818YDI0_9BILA|nr:unnamed protein product [Rotaria socialis]
MLPRFAFLFLLLKVVSPDDDQPEDISIDKDYPQASLHSAKQFIYLFQGIYKMRTEISGISEILQKMGTLTKEDLKTKTNNIESFIKFVGPHMKNDFRFQGLKNLVNEMQNVVTNLRNDAANDILNDFETFRVKLLNHGTTFVGKHSVLMDKLLDYYTKNSYIERFDDFHEIIKRILKETRFNNLMRLRSPYILFYLSFYPLQSPDSFSNEVSMIQVILKTIPIKPTSKRAKRKCTDASLTPSTSKRAKTDLSNNYLSLATMDADISSFNYGGGFVPPTISTGSEEFQVIDMSTLEEQFNLFYHGLFHPRECLIPRCVLQNIGLVQYVYKKFIEAGMVFEKGCFVWDPNCWNRIAITVDKHSISKKHHIIMSKQVDGLYFAFYRIMLQKCNVLSRLNLYGPLIDSLIDICPLLGKPSVNYDESIKTIRKYVQLNLDPCILIELEKYISYPQ